MYQDNTATFYSVPKFSEVKIISYTVFTQDSHNP